MMSSPDEIRLAMLEGKAKYLDSQQVHLLEQEAVEKARLGLCKCYEDMICFMNQWIDIPEHYKKLISIWLIGTYFHKKFDTYPYLFFNAMRGSGKTRTLRIISWLQANGKGDVLTNPSDSVIFRTAKETGLIFDEFESEKSKDKQTMREYLNACYKKGGVVYRMEKQKVDGKEQQVAMPHPLYTPIAMANINGIEDVLGDRSLTLILEKSMNPALVKKIEDFSRNKIIKEIKTNLSKFSVELCNVELLQKTLDGWNSFVDDKYSTQLHTIHNLHYSTSQHTQEELELYNRIDATNIFGRNLELLFPLILTAKLLGNNVFEEILTIAKGFNESKKVDEFAESKEVTLFEFVSKADRYRFEYVFVHDLFIEFQNFIGSMDEEERRTITTQWLGLALKRLKLIHDRKRVAKGMMVHLDVDKAKERLRIFKSEDKEEEVKNEN